MSGHSEPPLRANKRRTPRSKRHRCLYLKVARSIREAFFAHSQSDYDTLLGPFERDSAAKLRGHTAESGARRTPIPAQGGQHSGDCGQQVMAA